MGIAIALRSNSRPAPVPSPSRSSLLSDVEKTCQRKQHRAVPAVRAGLSKLRASQAQWTFYVLEARVRHHTHISSFHVASCSENRCPPTTILERRAIERMFGTQVPSTRKPLEPHLSCFHSTTNVPPLCCCALRVVHPIPISNFDILSLLWRRGLASTRSLVLRDIEKKSTSSTSTIPYARLCGIPPRAACHAPASRQGARIRQSSPFRTLALSTRVTSVRRITIH